MKPISQWTRRDFLRVSLGGALGAGGLIHFSKIAEALDDGGVSRFTGLPLQSFPTTCTLCPAGCGILGLVDNGRLKGLLGNPKDPNSRGNICVRGLMGMNLQDDEERILYPMARQGKRGEGRWKRITWDEAFELLARILAGAPAASRSRERPILIQPGRQELLTRRFIDALGDTGEIVSLNGRSDLSADMAHRLTWGEGGGIPDIDRTRLILNFGADPYSHHELYVPLVQRLVDARVTKKAKLISFDVRLSETAGLSDEWVPPAPGTDGIVALAMAHVIVERGLHDRSFIERWTNSSVERLRRHLSSFTPEKAQEESGISAERIRGLAVEFATTQPSVAFAGGGVSRHANGTETVRTILLLNAVVGNIDRPGGYCLPIGRPLDEPDLPRSSGAQSREMAPSEAFTRLIDGSLSTDLLLIYGDNPAYNLPQSDRIRESLKSQERISNLVVMDTHMTESAAYADLVLPAATYLESWGVEVRPSFERIPYLTIRQPILAPVPDAERLRNARINRYDRIVVRPRGEALAWSDLLFEVARRMGGSASRAFAFRDIEDYVESLLEQENGLKVQGGLEYLRRNGVWVDPSRKPVYRTYESGGFRTPTKRMELYSEALVKRGCTPLPSYRPAGVLPHREYRLVPFRSTASEGQPNAKWLCELHHENPVWINTATASELGLKQGDTVRVLREFNSILCTVRVTQGIHPGAVAISRGLGHWEYGHFAQAKPFKGNDPDSHHIWWEKRGHGTHVEPLIPLRLDPVSGAQIWMDTPVWIEKA